MSGSSLSSREDPTPEPEASLPLPALITIVLIGTVGVSAGLACFGIWMSRRRRRAHAKASRTRLIADLTTAEDGGGDDRAMFSDNGEHDEGYGSMSATSPTDQQQSRQQLEQLGGLTGSATTKSYVTFTSKGATTPRKLQKSATGWSRTPRKSIGEASISTSPLRRVFSRSGGKRSFSRASSSGSSSLPIFPRAVSIAGNLSSTFLPFSPSTASFSGTSTRKKWFSSSLSSSTLIPSASGALSTTGTNSRRDTVNSSWLDEDDLHGPKIGKSARKSRRQRIRDSWPLKTKTPTLPMVQPQAFRRPLSIEMQAKKLEDETMMGSVQAVPHGHRPSASMPTSLATYNNGNSHEFTDGARMSTPAQINSSKTLPEIPHPAHLKGSTGREQLPDLKGEPNNTNASPEKYRITSNGNPLWSLQRSTSPSASRSPSRSRRQASTDSTLSEILRSTERRLQDGSITGVARRNRAAQEAAAAALIRRTSRGTMGTSRESLLAEHNYNSQGGGLSRSGSTSSLYVRSASGTMKRAASVPSHPTNPNPAPSNNASWFPGHRRRISQASMLSETDSILNDPNAHEDIQSGLTSPSRASTLTIPELAGVPIYPAQTTEIQLQFPDPESARSSMSSALSTVYSEDETASADGGAKIGQIPTSNTVNTADTNNAGLVPLNVLVRHAAAASDPFASRGSFSISSSPDRPTSSHGWPTGGKGSQQHNLFRESVERQRDLRFRRSTMSQGPPGPMPASNPPSRPLPAPCAAGGKPYPFSRSSTCEPPASSAPGVRPISTSATSPIEQCISPIPGLAELPAALPAGQVRRNLSISSRASGQGVPKGPRSLSVASNSSNDSNANRSSLLNNNTLLNSIVLLPPAGGVGFRSIKIMGDETVPSPFPEPLRISRGHQQVQQQYQQEKQQRNSQQSQQHLSVMIPMHMQPSEDGSRSPSPSNGNNRPLSSVSQASNGNGNPRPVSNASPFMRLGVQNRQSGCSSVYSQNSNAKSSHAAPSVISAATRTTSKTLSLATTVSFSGVSRKDSSTTNRTVDTTDDDDNASFHTNSLLDLSASSPSQSPSPSLSLSRQPSSSSPLATSRVITSSTPPPTVPEKSARRLTVQLERLKLSESMTTVSGTGTGNEPATSTGGMATPPPKNPKRLSIQGTPPMSVPRSASRGRLSSSPSTGSGVTSALASTVAELRRMNSVVSTTSTVMTTSSTNSPMPSPLAVGASSGSPSMSARVKRRASSKNYLNALGSPHSSSLGSMIMKRSGSVGGNVGIASSHRTSNILRGSTPTSSPSGAAVLAPIGTGRPISGSGTPTRNSKSEKRTSTNGSLQGLSPSPTGGKVNGGGNGMRMSMSGLMSTVVSGTGSPTRNAAAAAARRRISTNNATSSMIIADGIHGGNASTRVSLLRERFAGATSMTTLPSSPTMGDIGKLDGSSGGDADGPEGKENDVFRASGNGSPQRRLSNKPKHKRSVSFRLPVVEFAVEPSPSPSDSLSPMPSPLSIQKESNANTPGSSSRSSLQGAQTLAPSTPSPAARRQSPLGLLSTPGSRGSMGSVSASVFGSVGGWSNGNRRSNDSLGLYDKDGFLIGSPMRPFPQTPGSVASGLRVRV